MCVISSRWRMQCVDDHRVKKGDCEAVGELALVVRRSS